MPLVEAFSFTPNTDADTFCTWLEDRSGTWKWDLSFTADKGRAVDTMGRRKRANKYREAMIAAWRRSSHKLSF